MSKQIALTGIQPSGAPHLGNYLGMIRPALRLMDEYQAYYFVADAHALNSVRDPKALRESTHVIAATWLALGLDPARAVLYRQSDVPEVFELAWMLSCVTPKGVLNRAHAYKAAVDENTRAGRSPDDGVNMGLFAYPLLMAADILAVGARVVPVGEDQRQHLEMTADIAEAFNRAYGEVLTVPEAVIDEAVATIPGLDGRKMSKSYGNTIPIFAEPEAQRRSVMRIVTDSRPPEEPKNPDEDKVFAIYRHLAPQPEAAEMRERYLRGRVGYGEVKQRLADLLEAAFVEPRRKYRELVDDRARIDAVLTDGARRARSVAGPSLERVRKAAGL